MTTKIKISERFTRPFDEAWDMLGMFVVAQAVTVAPEDGGDE